MKNSILLILMLIFVGCSTKVPNTLKYRVKQSPTVDIKLHVDIQGDGKPLILLHGFGMNRHNFRHLIDPLSKKFKVYNFDLKGFGDSPKPDDGRYSPYDQAVLIQNYIKKNNLRDVTLLGHSYGGGIALILSYLNQENIDKMILISPAAYKQNLPSLLSLMQKPIIGYIGYHLLPYSYKAKKSYEFAYFDNDKIKQEDINITIENMKKNNAESIFYKASFSLIPNDIDEITKNYSSIKTPTLIIWGYNDVIVRKRNGVRLKKDLQNAELKIIHNCGHIPQLEKSSEVIELILDYL